MPCHQPYSVGTSNKKYYLFVKRTCSCTTTTIAQALELPKADEVFDDNNQAIFRGPRVRMGIYRGRPTRIVPHTSTGRADYFGPLVNRAARFCHGAAHGGQVLVPKDIVEELVSGCSTPVQHPKLSVCLLTACSML